MTEPTTSDPAETAEEAQDAPETPEQAQGEAEAPPEPEQPAEAVDVTGRIVAVDSPAGSLTLRPNQKELDTEQHYALAAIGIDIAKDPGVIPHLRAFVHMCQIRGLDPFAREAYLIGRGKDNNRKYTMQTGIDGYRKMAKSTGRFVRVKATYWTGADDDDRSYRMVEVDGDFVMKRVWYDQWPASRGNPGAAKVVIEHYDDSNNLVTTEAVADWSMYAPYNDLWEYDQSARKRVQRFDKDGKPIKVLGDMWVKGGPHMLAKCAEALAHRKAFPAAMSGIYVTEEMHRADQQERDRTSREQAEARRKAYAEARGQQHTAAVVDSQGKPVEEPVDAEIVEEPTPATEAVAEAVQGIKADEEESKRLLLAELHWQADVLGQKVEALARRRIAALKRNVADFTADDLYPLVNGMRTMAAEAAKRSGVPEADAYATRAVDGAGPIDVNDLGPEDEAASQGDPAEEEHPFEDDGTGSCSDCGLGKDVGPHPEDEQ